MDWRWNGAGAWGQTTITSEMCVLEEVGCISKPFKVVFGVCWATVRTSEVSGKKVVCLILGDSVGSCALHLQKNELWESCNCDLSSRGACHHSLAVSYNQIGMRRIERAFVLERRW